MRIKRQDLIIETADGGYKCVLCGRGRDNAHAADCVFAQNCVTGIRIEGVTGIRIEGVSGGVVFRMSDSYWWWTSPASGKEYRVEKWPGRYIMRDADGNEVKSCKNLYTLRLWTGLNQGTL